MIVCVIWLEHDYLSLVERGRTSRCIIIITIIIIILCCCPGSYKLLWVCWAKFENNGFFYTLGSNWILTINLQHQRPSHDTAVAAYLQHQRPSHDTAVAANLQHQRPSHNTAVAANLQHQRPSQDTAVSANLQHQRPSHDTAVADNDLLMTVDLIILSITHKFVLRAAGRYIFIW